MPSDAIESPRENPFIESFNGRLRDECPNTEDFANPTEAQVVIEDWRNDYNHHRPHRALDGKRKLFKVVLRTNVMTVSDEQQTADPENRSGEREQPTTLSDCVASLTDAVSVGIELEIERNNLKANEFAALRLFSERDEWTATQLIERLPLDPSRMSRLVAKLVDRRLLRRRRARTDRRVVMLTLTEKGNELMSEVRENIESYEAVLLKNVSKNEMAGFLSTAHKILGNQPRSPQSSTQ